MSIGKQRTDRMQVGREFRAAVTPPARDTTTGQHLRSRITLARTFLDRLPEPAPPVVEDDPENDESRL
jgi:hypothetical protein